MLGARSGSSFGKKTGSGALYLKRRWIFKSLILIILKAFFFVSILLVSRRTIGVLDSENQPGSGKIRNGSGALGLTWDVHTKSMKTKKKALTLSKTFSRILKTSFELKIPGSCFFSSKPDPHP